VLRALGLDHAASSLDEASQKAIARSQPPTSLLDTLMRDQLRAHLEQRSRAALKRSGIFPLTSLDTYDFDYPKQIDKDVVHRAAGSISLRTRPTASSSARRASARRTSPTPSASSPACAGTAFDSLWPLTS
jgi:DNA replication protein DnaC